jgi:hypothetical protein
MHVPAQLVRLKTSYNPARLEVGIAYYLSTPFDCNIDKF